MVFPLEKILTCSARDYCDSKKVDISEYELRGVHAEVGLGGYLKSFVNSIPKDTEVITDFNYVAYKPGFGLEGGHLSGTALIPKNKKD